MLITRPHPVARKEAFMLLFKETLLSSKIRSLLTPSLAGQFTQVVDGNSTQTNINVYIK